MIPLVVGYGLDTECPLGSPWHLRPLNRVCPACTVSCGKTSALDHLPESVAGATVFDPIVRLGAPGIWDHSTECVQRVQCPVGKLSPGSSACVRCRSSVFDPMPRVGSAVGSNEAQRQCHPMVRAGRCKHPALHLRYHLQVRVNPEPGRPAQYTVPAAVIQAVCIATPGSARINVAYRLYSVDKLY
jgi:hypothetical protein